MSREEIIAAMQECSTKLGRVPSLDEFRVTMRVKKHYIQKHFSTFTKLLTEVGLERVGSGMPLTMESMFRDWGGVVRSTGKIPTVAEYHRQGAYSSRPYMSRFKYWREVPAGMLA